MNQMKSKYRLGECRTYFWSNAERNFMNKFVKKIIKDIRAEVGNGGLKLSEFNENFKDIQKFQHQYGRFSKFMQTDQDSKQKN